MILDYLLGLAQSTPVGVLILAILGTISVVATVVIAATPTKSDDDWYKKHILDNKYIGPLVKKLEFFSWLNRKEKK